MARETDERGERERRGSEPEDQAGDAARAEEHTNQLAREGGVAGDEDIGDGGGGGPSVVI